MNGFYFYDPVSENEYIFSEDYRTHYAANHDPKSLAIKLIIQPLLKKYYHDRKAMESVASHC